MGASKLEKVLRLSNDTLLVSAISSGRPSMNCEKSDRLKNKLQDLQRATIAKWDMILKFSFKRFNWLKVPEFLQTRIKYDK